jgi:hypothetical protein
MFYVDNFEKLSFEKKIAYSLVQMEIAEDLVSICPDSLAKNEVSVIRVFFEHAFTMRNLKRKSLPNDVKKIMRRLNSEAQQDEYAAMSASFEQLSESCTVSGFCLLMTIFGREDVIEDTMQMGYGLDMYVEDSLWDLEEVRRNSSVEYLLGDAEFDATVLERLREMAEPVRAIIAHHRESAKVRLAAIDEAKRLLPSAVIVDKTTILSDRQWQAYANAEFYSSLPPDQAARRLSQTLGFQFVPEEPFEDLAWGLKGDGRFFTVRTALYRGKHVRGRPKWALSNINEYFLSEENLKCRVLQPSEEFRLFLVSSLGDRFRDPGWEWAPNDPETDPISAAARQDGTYGKSPWTLAGGG